MATKTIRVDYLARVEGEGALDLEISGGRVVSAQLRIFEPPRFFEALLRGRAYTELPDIVARICGICPIAYQMSAVHAIENAFGVKVDGQLRALRRLIYCGEWIESHALHVVMLHAPDFLGFPTASRWRAIMATGARRAGAEESRQRTDARAGRARDPSGQCQARRLLPPCRAAPNWSRSRTA